MSAPGPSPAPPPSVPARSLERTLEVSTAILVAAEVLVVGLQVVSRHLVRSPIPWTEEIARLLLVWLMLVGGVLALQRHEHTRVTALLRLCPPDISAGLEAGGRAALVAFLAVLGYQSCLLTWTARLERLPASQLSGAWVTAPMPLAIALMLALATAGLLQNGRDVLRSPRSIVAAALATVAVAGTVLAPWLLEVSPLAVLVAGFILTAAVGTPLAFALGWVSLAYLVGTGVPLMIVPIKMVGGVDSFVLLAIPLFILGGALMEAGGLAERIVRLASALTGHVRGGLALVVLVAEMLFSGISGSTTADVSALSSLLIPSMKKAGYRGEEAVSIVASASAMGILVPPCLTMVVLGSLANLSIVTLFLAGFVPALVLAAVLALVIVVRARAQRWPRAERSSLRGLASAGQGAALPLGMPLIVFGGIFSGAVTVTEAAVVAVVYAALVGAVVYRELSPGQIGRLLATSGTVTAMTLWVLAAASVFAWILAREQVPESMAAWIQEVGGGAAVFMALSVAVFVVIGALLEGLPALLIFGPVLYPIALQLGIDPIHYGIVIVASLGVAFFLPPVGVGLYIACGIGKVDVNDVFRSYRPYLVALLVGLGLVAAFPTLTLVVPRIVQGYGGR